jgi:hypothetical protein
VCPPKIRIPAEELVGNPEARRIDEVSRQPRENELHTRVQIGECVRKRNGDQRWITKQDDAEEDGQVLQRLERLRAGHEHDGRPDVPRRRDEHECQQHRPDRFRVPRLPLAPERPCATHPERESAERADREGQADHETEPPPHIQQWERYVRKHGFEPRVDGSHYYMNVRPRPAGNQLSHRTMTDG